MRDIAVAIAIFLCLLSGCENTSRPLVRDFEPTPRELLDTEREEINLLNFLNDYRAQKGAGLLKLSPALKRSAQWMSDDMAQKNYFNHVDSLGRSLAQRIASFGYRADAFGENLAIAPNALAALNLWKGSPSHNANMLNPNYKVMGIGIAPSSQGVIWTTDFGTTIFGLTD